MNPASSTTAATTNKLRTARELASGSFAGPADAFHCADDFARGPLLAVPCHAGPLAFAFWPLSRFEPDQFGIAVLFSTGADCSTRQNVSIAGLGWPTSPPNASRIASN